MEVKITYQEVPDQDERLRQLVVLLLGAGKDNSNEKVHKEKRRERT